MKIVLAISISLLSASSAAIAAETPSSNLRKELAKCASIDGDLARLECYDQTASRHGLKKKTTTFPIVGKGKWDVTVETNPIDDSKTAIAFLPAESGTSRFGNPVSLSIRCRSNEIEAFISWGDFLGLESTNVLTRLGDAPAEEKMWSISTDNTATFYPGADLPFVRALLSTNRLVAQTTPHSANPVTAIFRLDGMPKAMSPLRIACPTQSIEPLSKNHFALEVATSDASGFRQFLSPEDHEAWDSRVDNEGARAIGCFDKEFHAIVVNIAASHPESQQALIADFAKLCGNAFQFSQHGKEAFSSYVAMKVKEASGQ